MTRKVTLADVSRWCWAGVLICLPVTSFRFFPLLGKETMVRPLSFYPLGLLIVVLFLRVLKDNYRPKLHKDFILIFGFLAVAAGATVFGALYSPIPMHGQDYWGRAIRAWATLIGGLAFFFTTAAMNQDEEDIRFTLKWLYVGLAVSIIWGMIQMISYYLGFPDRVTLNKVQLSFSIRKLLAKKRAAGFAFEPSWLANQLATIYIPWLFASILEGYRVFRKRWIEPVLFAGAILLLLLTFSRGGILNAGVACILTFVLTQTRFIKTWTRRFIEPFRTGQTTVGRPNRIAVRVIIMLVIMAIVSGTGYLLSQNKYFAQIWRSKETSLVEYAVDVYAGPRLAYATAGWEVFNQHPFTGVGLGASGLYLYDNMPDWAITTLSEITRQLTPEGWSYPNPKNMFIRILAETGLVGFGFYFLFLIAMLGHMIICLRGQESVARWIGVAGLTTWFAMLIFNFTQDSFIDPNTWLGFGLFAGVLVSFNHINPRRKQAQFP